MSRQPAPYSPVQNWPWLTSNGCQVGVFWVALVSLLLVSLVAAGCSRRDSATNRTRRGKNKAKAVVATSHSLPPIRQTRFLNTGADAKYLGNDSCTECHEGEHESYLHTTHSRALSEVDVAQEPPDFELTHELSGRSYRIYRDNGQLRHREFLKAPDGAELLLADYPMRYVIGSGNHSRSYLVEIDGFLFESPLTWYTSREAWDLSPGYADDPTQSGFSRAVMRDCVICHAGQVVPVDRSLHKLKIHEMAIGCERCHGPGSLHVERHRAGVAVTGEFDDTIVHPAHLPRARQEAICGQCHLATIAEANVRHRSLADFRPSLYLNDFRVRFTSEAESDEMTVVGHTEQMRASRCYQASPSMTCTTCHSMHGGNGDASPAKAGRQSCLACHQTEACGMELALRQAKSADDNCITCHMPKSRTDIPHFSFHHHRVGIHEEPSPQIAETETPPLKRFGKLVPVDDLSHLPQIEQDRCLGLAYVKMAEEGEVANPTLYYESAMTILEDVRQQGLKDAEVDATLARIYLRFGNKRLATDRGQSALLMEGLSDEKRRDAVGALSRIHANDKEFALAQPLLEQMIRFRYDAEDHLILSICRHRNGDLPGALRAAQAAVKIEPDRPDLHEAVSQLYSLSGANDQAEWHRVRTQQLFELLEVVVGEDSTSPSPASP